MTQYSEGSVLVGARGELYLIGAGQYILTFVAGEGKIPPKSIANFKSNMRTRRVMAKHYGFRFAHIISPEKHQVYDRDFPVEIKGSIINQYIEAGCDGFIYPADDLKTIDRSYYRTDTHWGPNGRAHIAGLIAEIAGIDPEANDARAMMREAIVPQPAPFIGNLGGLLRPQRKERAFTLRPQHGIDQFVSIPDVIDGQLVVLTREREEAEKTLLIFGSSSTHGSLRYISYYFQTIIHCRSPFLHEEIVLMARPDVVITFQVERKMRHVARDDEAPRFFLLPHLAGNKSPFDVDAARGIAMALAGGRKI